MLGRSEGIAKVRGDGPGRGARAFWQLVLLALGACGAQEVAVRDGGLAHVPTGEATCSGCTLRFDSITVLPHPSADSLMGDRTKGVLLSDGRAALFPAEPTGGIAVLNPRGELLALKGRQGDGPGELPSYGYLGEIRDSILVVAGPRGMLFTPAGDHVRSFTLPTQLLLFRQMPDGRIVAATPPSQRGSEVHLLNSDFSPVRAFGGHPGGAIEIRHVAPVDSGRLWASVPGRYRIELLDTMGTVLHAIERETSLFEPWSFEDAFQRNRFSMPVLSAIRDLHLIDDRLWLLLEVADADWQPTEGPDGEGGGMPSLSDVDSRSDFILEVLSTAGEVLASERLHGVVRWLTADGRVQIPREDESGMLRAHVWQARLDTGSGTP